MKSWQSVNLGSVVQLINGDRGKNYPSQKDFINDGIPFINAGHIQEGSIQFESMNYISQNKFDLLGSGKIQQNDILYCLRGSLGKTAIIQNFDKGAIASSLVIIRPSKDITIKYLYYFLTSYLGQAEIHKYDNGSAQPNLSAASVKAYTIPLPPLEEQKRIAAILDKADRVRRKRQEAIRLTEELGRSIFLDMFGDPVTNPKGWNFQKLGELLSESLQNGAYYPKEQYTNSSHGTEMVHMSDAFYEKVKRGMLKRVNIPLPDIQKYGLSSNDILIARRSLTYEGAAKPCLISESKEPLIFESSLIRVRVNQDLLDPIFFYFYLSLPSVRQIYLFPNVTKSTISGINQAGLKRVEIILPPIDIQRRFREVYAKVGELKTCYELEHLKESENLFNSLLQRAFRGEL